MLPTQGLKTHVTEMLSLREMEHTLRVMGPQKPESSASRLVCAMPDVKKEFLCPLFPERQKSCHLSRETGVQSVVKDLGNF